MDAITLLKKDHKTVEDLFRRFEQAGDRAYVEKRRIVDRIIEELSTHAAVEEQLFYPATRATVPETEDIALESIEEHHIVKWELHELQDMDPHDERFDAKVAVLIENVRHHVEEEENDYFPKVREELGRNDLNDLGEAMESARKVAPTRPHPRSPQAPPANAVVGLVAGAADFVGDTVKGVAQGSVSAVRTIVGRVTGSTNRGPAPTGSSRTRAVAADVRDAADAAVDEVEDTAATARRVASTADRGVKHTARTAAKGARSTAGAASSGASGAVTSAKKGAASTRATAKRAATTTGRTAKKAAGSTKKAAGSAARSTRTAAQR